MATVTRSLRTQLIVGLDDGEASVIDRYGVSVLEDHLNVGFFKHRKVQLIEDEKDEVISDINALDSDDRANLNNLLSRGRARRKRG